MPIARVYLPGPPSYAVTKRNWGATRPTWKANLLRNPSARGWAWRLTLTYEPGGRPPPGEIWSFEGIAATPPTKVLELVEPGNPAAPGNIAVEVPEPWNQAKAEVFLENVRVALAGGPGWQYSETFVDSSRAVITQFRVQGETFGINSARGEQLHATNQQQPEIQAILIGERPGLYPGNLPNVYTRAYDRDGLIRPEAWFW